MQKLNNKICSYYNFSQKQNFDILFLCDHASNKLPFYVKNLGLNNNNLLSHIAWDIGAKEVTLNLAKELNAHCLLCNFSRLLIDPNRKLIESDLIVKISDEQQIPYNININKKEVLHRINAYYKKYHQQIKNSVKKIYNPKKNLYIFAIHSFTKTFKKKSRYHEIGLLWNKNVALMLPMFEYFRKKKVSVGNNYPYSGYFFNFTLDNICKKKNIKSLSIEIRNDLICEAKGIKKWSMIVKESIINTIKRNNNE